MTLMHLFFSVLALFAVALGVLSHVPIWRDLIAVVKQSHASTFLVELAQAREAVVAALADAAAKAMARSYAMARLCRSVLTVGSGSSDAPAMKGSPSMFVRC